jgi:hypothetical protein
VATASEIVVQFRAGAIDEWDDAQARTRVGGILGALIPGLDVVPIFDQALMPGLIARAMHVTPGYTPPEFGAFYFVTFGSPLPIDTVRTAIKSLRSATQIVRWADFNYEPGEPGVLPFNDDYWQHLGHVDGANSAFMPLLPEVDPLDVQGTGGWYAWRFEGGDGRGVSFIDVERGWKRDHIDLKRQQIPPPIVGIEATGETTMRHGTNSLGVVCAVDNRRGVVGLAPRLDRVRVASYKRLPPRDPVEDRIADTITHCMDELPEGGVLLLEIHYRPPGGNNWLPVEVSVDVFAAIQLCVAAKIHVIEAAGNGGIDIDDAVGSWAPLEELGSEARDSGAIMVGSALESVNFPRKILTTTTLVDHERVASSNFGERVDCWAWGNRVATTSIDSAFADTYSEWGATSAASAIIAGVACSLQGAYAFDRGETLDPGDLRDYFREVGSPATKPWEIGDPLGSVFDGRIGLQPDVRRIIDEKFELPFPWVRDWPADVGEPDADEHWNSPDMVIKAAGAAIGATDLTDDALVSGDEARLHVRVHNRSSRPAGTVELDVFAATPAASFTKWDYLGEITLDGVPGNDHADDASLGWNSLPTNPWNIALMTVLRVDTLDPRFDKQRAPRPKREAWYRRLRSIAKRLGFSPTWAPKVERALDMEVMELEFEFDPDRPRGNAILEISVRVAESGRVFLAVPDAASRDFRDLPRRGTRRRRRMGIYELPGTGRHRFPLSRREGEGLVKAGILVHAGEFEDGQDVHVAVRQVACGVPSTGARWRIRPPEPSTGDDPVASETERITRRSSASS